MQRNVVYISLVYYVYFTHIIFLFRLIPVEWVIYQNATKFKVIP